MPDARHGGNGLVSIDNCEALRHLKESVAQGRPWHISLLESVALWTSPEEECDGRYYCYLIDGEAFDWLLLAERLSSEVADSIPQQELVDLLFFGKLPGELSEEDFRSLIGGVKYSAYLNYFYGVVVERFIMLAVEEEICKERQAYIFSSRGPGLEDSYERIYGANEATMLKRFRECRGYPDGEEVGLREFEEFTYWLFKYRLHNCDKERVASDTRKGLECLKGRMQGRRVPQAEPDPREIIDHLR